MAGVTNQTKMYWINWIKEQINTKIDNLVKSYFSPKCDFLGELDNTLRNEFLVSEIKRLGLEPLYHEYLEAEKIKDEHWTIYREYCTKVDALKSALNQSVRFVTKTNNYYGSQEYDVLIEKNFNFNNEIKEKYPEFSETYLQLSELRNSAEHNFMLATTDKKISEWVELYLKAVKELK